MDDSDNKKDICPFCNKVLQKRYEGLVCRNWNCPLYFKLEKGWVYLNNEKKDSMNFLKHSNDFDIESFENKKEWLKLKSSLLYKKNRCEICGEENFLQVHHILPKNSYPELTMDKENLIVLCKCCHKKIHSEDKYKFG